LVNPKSRGDLPEGWPRLLAETGVEPRIEWPDSADATRLLIEDAASQRTADRVVLAGGDGTIHQALPALLDAQLPLAVIPIGTANDLARTLDLPEDPIAALDVVGRGIPRPIDVGLANGTPFVNAATLGVGVRVNRELDADTKQRWGGLSYLRAAWRAVDKERPFDVEIDCDGEKERVRCIHVAVGNGVYHGGGVRIADDASISDGWLQLYTLPPSGALKLAALVPWLRRGNQDRWRGVRSARGRSIRLRTSRPLDVFADGERVSRTPIEFSILPGALDVIVPPPSSAQSETESLLRDPEEVALNELLAGCLALAESYSRLAESLVSENPDAAEVFASLAEARRRAASKLELDVRRMDELPAEPDPDRELLSLLTSLARGLVSADRTRALAEDRAAAERDLAARAGAVRQQKHLSARTLALVREIEQESAFAERRLTAFAQSARRREDARS
jgi:YegS/Rv2252/BmrU family lipid kinase